MRGVPPSRPTDAPEGQFMMCSQGYLGSNSVHNVAQQSAAITQMGPEQTRHYIQPSKPPWALLIAFCLFVFCKKKIPIKLLNMSI